MHLKKIFDALKNTLSIDVEDFKSKRLRALVSTAQITKDIKSNIYM